jgi:hypothetical protein
MRIEFDPKELGPQKWTATTDDGGYDGSGVTPLDAICELVAALEAALVDQEGKR